MTRISVSLTPTILILLVWPLPRSLAATYGISVDFSSSPYLDVSVQAVPHIYLWIQYMLRRYCLRGFPHSEICGSMDICSSPQLIAACHVLRRLLVPRHSPCALFSLTFELYGQILLIVDSHNLLFKGSMCIQTHLIASSFSLYLLYFSSLFGFQGTI
jgi:hypothetical protein